MILRNYYAIFMVGYVTRVFVDLFYERVPGRFGRELLYDTCEMIWDAIPIACLLKFHFENYKPHSQALIIRYADGNSQSSHDDV